MVGASHDYKFVLWKPDDDAGAGLKLAAEKANTTILEKEIFAAVITYIHKQQKQAG